MILEDWAFGAHEAQAPIESSQPRCIRRLINYPIADRSMIGIKIGAKAFCPSQGWNRFMQDNAYHSSTINKRRFIPRKVCQRRAPVYQ